jgi:hypothetical protein
MRLIVSMPPKHLFGEIPPVAARQMTSRRLSSTCGDRAKSQSLPIATADYGIAYRMFNERRRTAETHDMYGRDPFGWRVEGELTSKRKRGVLNALKAVEFIDPVPRKGWAQ